MIYTSQSATLPGHNPALGMSPEQIDQRFAEITGAPEHLEPLRVAEETVQAVGDLAIGHVAGPNGEAEDITVAVGVGAARLPERFYAPGYAPEKPLEAVVATQLESAVARQTAVHPAVAWKHMQEQQRASQEQFDLDERDNEGDEDGKDGKETVSR